jgi:hypothetical protein
VVRMASPHMFNIRNSRSDLRPPHIPSNMPSSHSSGGFYEMQISIQQDFGGIEMEHHRADLLKRLDHVIRRLDRGLEHFKQHDPEFDEAYLQRTKHQYQYLREILLEANATSYVSFNDHAAPSSDSCLRVSHNISVAPSPVPSVSQVEYRATTPSTSFIPPS